MTTTAAAVQPEPDLKNPHFRTKNDMRLDDVTVSQKIQSYPAEIQEPVLWLAGYARERCAGRRDIVVDHLHKKGFRKVTDNYVYRVLTGRYFLPDPSTGKLAGSAKNLAQMIDALRAGVLLTERAGKTPFVETSTWHDINDFITRKRTPESVCKFGVIIGPTGSQKTESVKRYCHLNNHGTCVHLEAPEKPSIRTFLTDLTARYGNSKTAHTVNKIENIRAAVTDKKMIAVDNVQRLYKPGHGGDQPIFNYLQKLQDDTGCTIILMFASLGADFLTRGLENGYFEQFEGRAGGREDFLILDDYTPAEDLLAFATAYGLQGTDEEIGYLEKISRKPGRVRILCDALQRGKRLAESQKKTFTIEHVYEVRGEVSK